MSRAERITALKLLEAWYGRGPTSLRVREVKCPDVAQEDGERVIIHLLLEGVLREDFHFTPYSTISYILPGPKAKAVSTGLRVFMDLRSGGSNSLQVRQGPRVGGGGGLGEEGAGGGVFKPPAFGQLGPYLWSSSRMYPFQKMKRSRTRDISNAFPAILRDSRVHKCSAKRVPGPPSHFTTAYMLLTWILQLQIDGIGKGTRPSRICAWVEKQINQIWIFVTSKSVVEQCGWYPCANFRLEKLLITVHFLYESFQLLRLNLPPYLPSPIKKVRYSG